VRVGVKLIDIRPLLRDELDGQRKGAGRIDLVVTKYLVVGGASLQHLRLECNLDRDSLFVLHGADSSNQLHWLSDYEHL